MGRELEYTATEYYSPCFHRQVFDDAAEKRMREGEEKERDREREKRGNWGKNCREVRENLDAKGSVERKKKKEVLDGGKEPFRVSFRAVNDLWFIACLRSFLEYPWGAREMSTQMFPSAIFLRRSEQSFRCVPER